MKKLLLGTLPLAVVLLLPLPTMARLNVDVHISLPPAIQFVEPPQLIVLPETNVYVVPEAEVDIFFSDGWYWRSWQGGWYRSRDYNSGWSQYRNTPSFYAEIPSGWRDDYREHRWRGHEWNSQRISHQEVQRNWDRWERDRYWEKQQTWGVEGLHVSSRSGADVNVSISLPPPIEFREPPQMIVLPETYVYVVPDVDVDIFFYEGWWWRPWQGGWYRSRDYNSGWDHYRSVPSFYAEIPSGWRDEYREHRWRGHQWDIQRISQQQVQQNWSGWQKNRHWERQQTWGVQGLNVLIQSQQPSRSVQQQQYQPQYKKAKPQQQYKKIKPQHFQKQQGNNGHGNNGKGNNGKGHGNGKK